MPRAFGERALHEQLADADAKAAADQLVEQEAPGVSSSSQYDGDARGLLLGREAAQRQQALLDPLGEAEVARRARRRQHVRDGLGEVADRLVAGVEEPVVDAGARGTRAPTARRSARPGAACRRRGSRPPRRRRAARPRRSSASARRPWRASRCSRSSSAKRRAKRFMRRRRRPARPRRPPRPSRARTCSRSAAPSRRLVVVAVAVLGRERARLEALLARASAPSPPRSRA